MRAVDAGLRLRGAGLGIVTHLVNFILMVGIIRPAGRSSPTTPGCTANPLRPTRNGCGSAARSPRPGWTAKDDAIMLSPLFGLPGGRHTIGVARHWHFILDILFVINGIVFIVLTFTTQQYLKLVPTQWSILPAAGSCLLQYGALHLPAEPGGYFRFDALQQLSYFFIVFVTAPLAILSGLAMSPALDNRFKWYQRLFGNRQVARSVHFLIMVTFLAFFAVHMIMVVSTHFARNLNAITLDQNKYNLNGVVLTLLAYAVLIGLNVWAVRFSWTHTRVLQKISNMTVGRVMDLLFDHDAPGPNTARRTSARISGPTGSCPPATPDAPQGRGVPRLPRQGPRPGRASGRAVAAGPARAGHAATRSRCTTASRDGRRSANRQGCPSPP